jgi:endonuclease/exonuclease/phosphatase family metal-dependent hydrolase
MAGREEGSVMKQRIGLVLTSLWFAAQPVGAPAHTVDPVDPIINEFVFNHTGTDFNEYVEILATPNTDYFDIWVLQLEGDSDKGQIDVARRFGTTDAHGLRTTFYQVNDFENGTSTLILVEGFTGSEGDDVDTDNDGVIDNMPWTRRLDDCVAVSDGGPTDVVYCDLVLERDFDGGIFTVGGASRIPNGTDTGAVSDWVRNDFSGEGIPGFNGTLDPATETLNTPAGPNRRNYASGGGSAPAALGIHDVQGTRHRSPFEGQAVTDLEGVVVAIDDSPSFARGFYMHDPSPDSDARTSEGIFVLTGSTRPSSLGLSPGSLVTVDGVVEENRPAANVENLTITRIRANRTPADQIEVVGTGTFAPAVIGAAGDVPPRVTISNVRGHVEDGSQLKRGQGLDFYERFEGMLVEIRNAVAVSPTNRFGEVWVVGDGGTRATGINSRGGITVRKQDFNPERIQIDDGIDFGATRGVNVGDALGTIVGVMSYDFENFEVDTLADLNVTPGGLAPETTSLESGPQQLTIATFNVLNLSPFAGSRFDDLAGIIVDNLGAPDILALQEIQDNDGTNDSGTVAADETFGLLINAIEAADPGLAYDYAQIDPVDGQDGGVPGGNIRVGYLFRTDRVALAPGTPGDATTNTTVLPGPNLSLNPGRILDTDTSDGDVFATSRKPLAAHFLFSGQSVFVVNNHFNSKGGDQPLYGPSQPPALVSEAQRLEQAERVRAFVDEIRAEDHKAFVIVLGDLNDFDFSAPLRRLQQSPGGAALQNLIADLKSTERYTFLFDGNSQSLDTILVNPPHHRGAEVDVVHTNIEFDVQASDHDPVLARITLKH